MTTTKRPWPTIERVLNKRARRKREYLMRHWPGMPKPSRSKRARGKIRVAILGAALNHRGRYPINPGRYQ